MENEIKPNDFKFVRKRNNYLKETFENDQTIELFNHTLHLIEFNGRVSDEWR